MAHRDKSQSPEFTVGIDAKRTFEDKAVSAEPVANDPNRTFGSSAGTICGFDYIARLARYSQMRVTARRDVADHGWRLRLRHSEKLLRVLLSIPFL
jgi:hypothetical protein